MGFQLTRRAVLTGGVAATLAAGLDIWTGQKVRVAHYTIPGRPGAQTPLRIVFLSDPHVIEPWFSLEAWNEVIESANALEPDLVILGGDYSGYNIPHEHLVMPEPIARAATRLRAQLGVYVIMGNHDHVANDLLGGTWAGKLALERGFEDANLVVLRNESVRLLHKGRPFWLAGTDSDAVFSSGGSTPMNLQKALAPALNDEAPLFLAAHEPDVFARHHPRVDLQISGHMHAGQVKIGRWAPAPMPSRYGTRYLHGLIQEEGKSLIVSSGLGYSRLPVRINAQPEIVSIETWI